MAPRLHLLPAELSCPNLGKGEETAMSELDLPSTRINRVNILLLGIAGVYALASLFLLFEMQGRIGKVETAQAATTSDVSKTNSSIPKNPRCRRGLGLWPK